MKKKEKDEQDEYFTYAPEFKLKMTKKDKKYYIFNIFYATIKILYKISRQIKK